MTIDWQALKEAYVTGRESYRTLAQRHGLGASVVSAAGKKEGWARARRQYRQARQAGHGMQAEQAMQAVRDAEHTPRPQGARTGEQDTEQLLRLQEIALDTVALLADVLDDPNQFKRHLVVSRTTGVGSETEERIFEKLDMSALRAYAASMQSMTATVRNLFDLPTKREKQAMELQDARLQLEEERRMAAGAGTGETGIAQIAAVLPQEDGMTSDEPFPAADGACAHGAEYDGSAAYADGRIDGSLCPDGTLGWDDAGLRLVDDASADDREGDFV